MILSNTKDLEIILNYHFSLYIFMQTRIILKIWYRLLLQNID